MLGAYGKVPKCTKVMQMPGGRPAESDHWSEEEQGLHGWHRRDVTVESFRSESREHNLLVVSNRKEIRAV